MDLIACEVYYQKRQTNSTVVMQIHCPTRLSNQSQFIFSHISPSLRLPRTWRMHASTWWQIALIAFKVKICPSAATCINISNWYVCNLRARILVIFRLQLIRIWAKNSTTRLNVSCVSSSRGLPCCFSSLHPNNSPLHSSLLSYTNASGMPTSRHFELYCLFVCLRPFIFQTSIHLCLLYTSDAADE